MKIVVGAIQFRSLTITLPSSSSRKNGSEEFDIQRGLRCLGKVGFVISDSYRPVIESDEFYSVFYNAANMRG